MLPTESFTTCTCGWWECSVTCFQIADVWLINKVVSSLLLWNIFFLVDVEHNLLWRLLVQNWFLGKPGVYLSVKLWCVDSCSFSSIGVPPSSCSVTSGHWFKFCLWPMNDKKKKKKTKRAAQRFVLSRLITVGQPVKVTTLHKNSSRWPLITVIPLK